MSPAVGRGPSGPGFGRAQWAGERASRGSRGRNLRGLLALLRPYRLRVAAMFTALLLGTAASLAPPLLAKIAIDDGISKHDTTTLVLVVLAFMLSALIVWAMTYVQTYLVGWVGQRALADLRIRIFTHLQSLPIGFYESRPAGVLISRMTNDIEALDSLVTDSVVTLFQASVKSCRTIRKSPSRRCSSISVISRCTMAGFLPLPPNSISRIGKMRDGLSSSTAFPSYGLRPSDTMQVGEGSPSRNSA